MAIHTGCVVIELERADEGRLLKYLHEHVYSYNWILKEAGKEISKIRVCVWWKEEDYRMFCTTPLRSFLKRLKNKTTADTIKISSKISTEEGIQKVCKGIPASISKYYLEAPLYPYLRGLLSLDLPTAGELPSDRTARPTAGELPSNRITANAKVNFILKTVDALDISAKIELLQKIAAAVAVQAMKLEKRLSEANENAPSPLSTHTGESTCSSLFDEPKMEEMEPLFSFEDPVLPIIPSAPLMF